MRCLAALLLLAAAAPAAAQVTVVEENELEQGQVVERGYVQGQGRGIQYGAYLVSPYHLQPIRRPGGSIDRIAHGGGGGVLARIGWELPQGFSFEIYGGFAVNAVNTMGADVKDTLMRAGFGAGFRYSFFNQSAFVPFVQIGLGLRWLYFEWPSGDEVNGGLTVPLGGLVGAQIELSPWVGIELGLAVDYMLGVDTLAEGVASVMPFLGVTLYAYDEND